MDQNVLRFFAEEKLFFLLMNLLFTQIFLTRKAHSNLFSFLYLNIFVYFNKKKEKFKIVFNLS